MLFYDISQIYNVTLTITVRTLMFLTIPLLFAEKFTQCSLQVSGMDTVAK
jgi:hypothetical protein